MTGGLQRVSRPELGSRRRRAADELVQPRVVEDLTHLAGVIDAQRLEPEACGLDRFGD